MNNWRRSRRTLYNTKSQISRILHKARMTSRRKSYFNFDLVKLFLDMKAVSLTSYDFNDFNFLWFYMTVVSRVAVVAS